MINMYMDTLKRRFNVYSRRNLKFDIVAAFVVFLVAIPLCLGIALASRAPLYSGLLSGIIGGLIVGVISNSQVSVSGPAAGMAAVVFTAITQLGDFNTFLFALTLAGILQIMLGVFKIGFLAEYIPSNVIYGLLAAIGILIIIKQLPFAFTVSTELNDLLLHLTETSEALKFGPFTNFLNHLNVGAIIISTLSFALLIYFDNTKIKSLQNVPAPIVVVLAGIVLNSIFIYFHLPVAQYNPHLVNIPEFDGITGFVNEFQFPNWSAFTKPAVYVYAILICAIASIESLLNIKASEKIDKQHRHCAKDRELIAQGTGNTIAGLIGAIPVTSVIVRTTVNVQSGAKTKASAILHSVFLFIAILAITDILNRIPLASLAAVLIYIGYKLTTPKLYKTIYKQGWDRFIPFITTIVGILIFNLLIGVLIGLLVSLLLILKVNSQVRIDIIKEKYPNGTVCRLILPQQITFLSKAALIQEFDSLPKGCRLIIDATYCDFIDKEILELIKELRKHRAANKSIILNLIGFKAKYNIQNQINFITVTAYKTKTSLHPYQILSLLREGNERFAKRYPLKKNNTIDAKYNPRQQLPLAVVVGCIDTHVPIETIFDMGFGDLFCISVAANLPSPDIQENLEYACNIAGIKLIIILGHTPCGVIETVYKQDQTPNEFSAITNTLLPIIKKAEKASIQDVPYKALLHKIITYNLAQTIIEIYNNNKLKKLIDNQNVGIIGGIYDLKTRKVTFQDLKSELTELTNEKDEKIINNIKTLLKQSKNYI